MIRVEVKTIWQGKVAVRDKYVDMALDNREGLIIVHSDDVMVIPFHGIQDRISGRSELPVKDRFSRDKHFLIYFNWQPDVKQAMLI
jgi:hypothetical protein